MLKQRYEKFRQDRFSAQADWQTRMQDAPLLGSGESPVRPRRIGFDEERSRLRPLAIVLGLSLGVWLSQQPLHSTPSPGIPPIVQSTAPVPAAPARMQAAATARAVATPAERKPDAPRGSS